MIRFGRYKGIVKLISAFCGLLMSCASPTDTPFVEELDESVVAGLSPDEAEFYHLIRGWLDDIPTSMKCLWVDVSYDDMFELLAGIKANQQKWTDEGNLLWDETYDHVVCQVEDYFQRWSQYEIDNRLENFVRIELKGKRLTGTGLHCDYEIRSDIGDLSSLEGSVWFWDDDVRSGKTRHHFYLYESKDSVPASEIQLYDKDTYGYFDDEIVATPVEQLPFHYELKWVKVNGEYINDDSHYKDIPPIVTDTWKRFGRNRTDYRELREFYTYIVPTVASKLGVEYKTAGQVLEEYFAKKGDGINSKANKAYQQIREYRL